MAERLMSIIQLILANWQRVVTGGVILVCGIIVLMGILKKILIGKISNKLLRKFALAFTSIILVFPATALYFFGDGIDFGYYWYACLLVGIGTVITYWLYENTCLRDLIALIGEKTIVKYATAIYNAIKDGKKDVKVELVEATTDLKSDVSTTLAATSTKSATKKSEADDLADL